MAAKASRCAVPLTHRGVLQAGRVQRLTVDVWPNKMGTMGVGKQHSNEIVFNLKGYCRKDGVATGCVSYCPSLNIFSHGKDSNDARDHLWKAVRLYLEISLKNHTLNTTVDKVMKAAEFEPGEIEQEFVWVREKEFDTAFDMAIPFSLHRPARAI
jgi:hypothetical protein